MTSDKSTLRRGLRRQRQALSSRTRAMAANRVVSRLSRLAWFRQARDVAIYLPHQGELDLSGLPQRAPGKNYFLPLLPPRRGEPLNFAPLRERARLRRNRYGIPEPVADPRQRVAAARLDLVVVPLVAFDRRGGRLGMGGGYYDATLAFLARRQAWLTPKVIGVAYAMQEVAALPLDPWDALMMAIVTEAGVIKTV